MQSRAKIAQSKQRRFSRWLHNSRINVHRLYSPLIQAALSGWEEEGLYLSLDTSVLWNQYCLKRERCGLSGTGGTCCLASARASE